MKGSHIFWLAIGMSVLIAGTIDAFFWDILPGNDWEVPLIVLTTIWVFVEIIILMEDDIEVSIPVYGPLTTLLFIIKKLNKFLDKHMSI